ncbi:MAG TPA: uracil-DNA glycosylase family protein [Anaerolineales bacterium]|nr:uracil-DNA glycosylase family protein [Anaerolineales bacterium]
MKSSLRQNRFELLQREMRACRVCLQAGYFVQPPAITKGKLGAKIMTIGQAPGITEVEAGRPFNAGSGKRLFQWLGKAGIDEDWFRSTQYMTAVTKCFPGKMKNGGGDRVPSRAEQELCRHFLEEELKLINPKLIIPIGRLAIERFFGTDNSLEELIGTELHQDGRWIVPLPHPSGASRWHQVPENRKRIDKAIRSIARRYRQLFPTRGLSNSS